MLPTGYTEQIFTDPNHTFTDFVWRCARAYVPKAILAVLGEELSNDPLPLLIPGTAQHERLLQPARDRLKQAEAELAVLDRMTAHEKQVASVKTSMDRQKIYMDAARSRIEHEQRLMQFVFNLEAWPEYVDLQPLRNFMAQQLSASLGNPTDFFRAPGPVIEDVDKWFSAAIDASEREVSSCESEIARTEALVRQYNDLVRTITTVLGEEQKGAK